ncbi:MAG: hypothetical protein Q4D13_03040 [Erysipelotrichaceae bacterium]|nr:hypothetical protein [Erysipelotrichaceae bacterium]
MNKEKEILKNASDSESSKIIREEAMQAFLAIRAQAKIDFPDGMSLEEINRVIQETRNSEHA